LGAGTVTRVAELTKTARFPKQCISRMEDLMDDLHDNAKLRPIIDDGEGDIPLWNKMIARYLCVGPLLNPTTRGWV
jgi:hypothetical protein